MTDNEIKALELRARSGDGDALLSLGRHYEALGDSKRARGFFAGAAKVGKIAGLRLLAINLLTREPTVEVDGVNMIRSAADKGDAEAMYVCGMLAAQDSDLADRWQVARECLERAADRGWAFARVQLDFLASMDTKALTDSRPAKSVFEMPRVRVIENFASAEICDWLINRARPRMDRAPVYDRATGARSLAEARTNSSFVFDFASSDLILMMLGDGIAKTAGLTSKSLEAPAVLHYMPGQQFEPHVDFLDPGNAAYARDLAENGQRVATFLLYLNDDFEGGETDFPELAWRYKGRKGDALLFWNVDSSGAPEPKAEHAGLPPTKGEKWLLSQWIRQRPLR